MNQARETVLIADDDRPFCGALAAALRRRGFAVAVAYTTGEALCEAAAWQPDKAVVDLRIPEHNGLELVSTLRVELPDLKIVVLTGYGSIATAVEAIKRGASHYLTKPATVDDILTAFERGIPDPSVDLAEKPMPLDDVEWEHIEQVLTDAKGNVSVAARRLGIHRRTLQRKLARRRPH